MDQKQLCDSMIDEKNKLINDFETDLIYSLSVIRNKLEI